MYCAINGTANETMMPKINLTVCQNYLGPISLEKVNQKSNNNQQVCEHGSQTFDFNSVSLKVTKSFVKEKHTVTFQFEYKPLFCMKI